VIAYRSVGHGSYFWLALLVVASACSGRGPVGRATSSGVQKTTPIAVETDLIALPNGREKTILLSEGFAYMHYQIEALDPPTHTYVVRLVASGRSDLSVWMESDVPLRVSDGTLRDPSCSRSKAETVCEWAFPMLEARPPGTWTVHVLKRSIQRSVVKITVLFEPPD
jgi:hypothetical protein